MQDVWLSIGGLIFAIILSMKVVTLADLYVMRYNNLVRSFMEALHLDSF